MTLNGEAESAQSIIGQAVSPALQHYGWGLVEGDHVLYNRAEHQLVGEVVYALLQGDVDRVVSIAEGIEVNNYVY